MSNSKNASESIWQRGRLDTRAGPQQLLFGRMYEDASIELQAFRPGGRIMCIASAGCTAMNLAPSHEVVAVDINPVQLNYARMRFNGDPGFPGRAEHIMKVMRFFGVLPGWWPSRVRTFLELDKPVEQMDYWEKFLNTWRFRYVFDVLLSVTVLRSVYHPRFLNFLPKRLGPVIRGRMERCFSRHPNRYNPFARSLFLGEFSSDPAPAQAKDIRLVHADAADFLENEPPGSFDGFTLSNILDGTDDAYRQRLFSAIKHTARPGAVTVIRSISEIDAASPNNHAAEDRSILWGSVLVRPVSEL